MCNRTDGRRFLPSGVVLRIPPKRVIPRREVLEVAEISSTAVASLDHATLPAGTLCGSPEISKASTAVNGSWLWDAGCFALSCLRCATMGLRLSRAPGSGVRAPTKPPSPWSPAPSHATRAATVTPTDAEPPRSGRSSSRGAAAAEVPEGGRGRTLTGPALGGRGTPAGGISTLRLAGACEPGSRPVAPRAAGAPRPWLSKKLSQGSASSSIFPDPDEVGLPVLRSCRRPLMVFLDRAPRCGRPAGSSCCAT